MEKYTVLPADTIYIGNFHLAPQYLQAKSDFVDTDWVNERSSGHLGWRNSKTGDWLYDATYRDLLNKQTIIVLSSEYKEGDCFYLTDVSLTTTIVDVVYGQMDIYRDIDLPYIHNIEPFFNWMYKEIENNSKYRIIRNHSISFSNFQEILHNYLYDERKPIKSFRLSNKDGKSREIDTFEPIDYDVFCRHCENILAKNNYRGVLTTQDRDYNNSELLAFIEYAMVESLVSDFFPSARKEINEFHQSGIERCFDKMKKCETFQNAEPIFEELCKKLVSEDGTCETKGGEFLRGVMKFMYHMFNDGDSPISLNREGSFWAFVNCFYTIISSNENYSLYMDIISPEQKKTFSEHNTGRISIENDMDPWMVINMLLFAVRYVETEEGKLPNTELDLYCKKFIPNFIEPIGNYISYYGIFIKHESYV